MFLDLKLDFKGHIQNVFNKVSKTIGLLRNLQKILPRPPLITIYISFIRPHLVYGDLRSTYNVSFIRTLESIQYNVVLAITRDITETSRVKLYHKLGFESLKGRRWYRKLCCFYKIFKTQSPSYLFDVIPTAENYFFPSSVIEWNKLDLNICNSESLTSFKSNILKFIHPSENT